MSKAKTTKKGLAEKSFAIPHPESPGMVRRTLPLTAEEIEAARSRSDQPLLFSFRFFDRSHDAFNLGNTDRPWFLTLLDALKDVSALTRHRLAVELKNHYRFHPHNWEKTRFKYDLNDELLAQVECVQFFLTKGDGRVHGFLVGNRFYVVWLDPDHNLYPEEKHVNYSLYPCSQYETLQRENERLRSRCDQLLNENKRLVDDNSVLSQWLEEKRS